MPYHISIVGWKRGTKIWRGRLCISRIRSHVRLFRCESNVPCCFYRPSWGRTKPVSGVRHLASGPVHYHAYLPLERNPRL